MKKTLQILRLKEVCQRLGISRSTVYRNVKNGTLPDKIKITQRCVGWYEDDINEYLDNLNEDKQ